MTEALNPISELCSVAQQRSSEERTLYEHHHGGRYAEISKEKLQGQPISDFIASLKLELDELHDLARWPGEPIPLPKSILSRTQEAEDIGTEFGEPTALQKVINKFSFDERVELFRKALILRAWEQRKDYRNARNQIQENVDFLPQAIMALQNIPTPQHRQKTLRSHEQAGTNTDSLDLTSSTAPECAHLIRALVALQNQLETEEKHGFTSETADHPQNLTNEVRKFILGILNPSDKVKYFNITDVYGSEADVPNAENDATRIRVESHRQELEKRYGVSIEAFDQGTSIQCPEQCGFDALAAINQARRIEPQQRILPRFVVLNNAARTASADGIQEGAEKSKSSALLYFSFDLGDRVLHKGLAYGHQTLTYLKPYLTKLWELEGTEEGTQFRSLEFEQHLAVASCLGDKALPAYHKARKLDIDVIPEIALAANEVQYLGSDKYGNGITPVSGPAFISQFLRDGDETAKVQLTFLDRKKNIIRISEQPYTIARSLGAVRDGSCAGWESSTPTSEDPKAGFFSLGCFMKAPGDTNPDIIDLEPGTIVRVEKTENRE